MNNNKKWVEHGSNWAEHEDKLIGSREGLECLRNDIDKALLWKESGTTLENSWIVGIKIVDQHPDAGKKNDTTSWVSWLVFVIIFIIGFSLMVLGLVKLSEFIAA